MSQFLQFTAGLMKRWPPHSGQLETEMGILQLYQCHFGCNVGDFAAGMLIRSLIDWVENIYSFKTFRFIDIDSKVQKRTQVECLLDEIYLAYKLNKWWLFRHTHYNKQKYCYWIAYCPQNITPKVRNDENGKGWCVR